MSSKEKLPETSLGLPELEFDPIVGPAHSVPLEKIDSKAEKTSELDDDDDRIIRTGADAAQYMLSDRDDGDAAITVRSMVLGTAFAAFYAAISQIYMVSAQAIGAGYS